MPDLLLELFSEEIPARMQARAAQDLKRLVLAGLAEEELAPADPEQAVAHVTPRRLCLHLPRLPAESPARREERRGPRADAPAQAIAGFLRSTGLERDQLEERDTKKGRFLFAVIQTPGRPAADIAAGVVADVITNFPWPKSMRWGSGSLRWVRPLHHILCILHDETGAEVVPVALDGIPCGDRTRGHRFMAPGEFSVTSFDDYKAKLRQAKVMLDAGQRRDHIVAEATRLAGEQGLELVPDPRLLDELAGLSEWPVVLADRIDPAFLELPPEVLQTSMREHQKFLSLRNPASGQIEGFVTVAGRETADGGRTILAGNRKVLAARLADARFFWENDLQTVREKGLEGMAAALAQVTFHRKLGSQGERIARIAALSREIAPLVGADPAQAEAAARICKADLASEMVYEFPELQGVMGRYYALEAGLPQAVADACRDHYAPLGPDDDVPTAPVSIAVALADKLDMLAGFWAIDEKPTGSKDPFALRRAALGVIRIVLENGVRMGLGRFVDTQLLVHEMARERKMDQASERALKSVLSEIGRHGVFGAALRAVRAARRGETPASAPEAEPPAMRRIADRLPQVACDLLTFFHDRLKVHLREEGIRHDVIDACLAMPGNDDLWLVVHRARALAAFLDTPDGENLLQGFKRANNILTAEERRDGVAYEGAPDVKFAEHDAERALFDALDNAEAALAPALAAEDFAAAMTVLAGLRAPIDAFFEAVQVNADNPIIRRNRLCLLHRIRAVMGQVADFTRIEG